MLKWSQQVSRRTSRHVCKCRTHIKFTIHANWDLYLSVMWRYMIPNKIFNMKMKLCKPFHSYPTLTYQQCILLRWQTHTKVEVTNPFGSMGYWADRAKGSDRPNHRGLSDREGGALELGCNTPRRRTLWKQTKGRWHSGSCGESKSYKGVNHD